MSNRTQRDRCPWCDYGVDAATGITDKDARPSEGDITLCLNCTSVLQFGPKLLLAKITDEEIRSRLSAKEYAVLMDARRVMLKMDRRKVGRNA